MLLTSPRLDQLLLNFHRFVQRWVSHLIDTGFPQLLLQGCRRFRLTVYQEDLLNLQLGRLGVFQQ